MAEVSESLKKKVEELKLQEKQAFQVYCSTNGQLRAMEEALDMVLSAMSEEQIDKINEVNNKNKK
tara:strand:+ start:2002 stop:2196 length:195 start_codon:yes stop_codon:yes gene_type:complete